ncbi:hypothetical protein FLJC2902T_17760 [Flavobacterium limnosediminis JC2902]|uniref:DUF3667 domain-containing protein n=1 Tax=Flavobacterium limnosediminis JC2902 TaxID=1341181 RepID=V6SVF5_9FLAO|nr:DUF3667 domain-containing protein [Flavobacterium limnosediminis]ESU28415.1 hypothetical protein FLJC2902T_17760 [Flavobacterium limnosediminis JC2902]
MHDVLHGVWHFEKGMLFTAKEALLRPGKAALDYIGGKRIRYYNVFYFILLLLGLNFFLNHYYDQISAEYYSISNTDTHIKNGFEKFISSNAKSIILSFVPFFALNSLILFRRKKFNLSEHFIIAGITFLGILILVTFSNASGFLNFIKYLYFISILDGYLTPLVIIAYTIRSYYSTFSDSYTKFGFSLRMFLFLLFLAIEFILLMLIIFGYVTDWKSGSFSYHS